MSTSEQIQVSLKSHPLEHGEIKVPNTPGLGLEIDWNKLEQFIEKKETLF